jgi:L-fuculose-phosphate aldolase
MRKNEDLHIINIRKEVVDVSKMLSRQGLTTGSWGNISARIDKDSYAITPSGHSYETLTPDDIIIVNNKGIKMTGNLYPSSETKLHVAIYNQFKDSGAVIHTHSVFSSVMAVLHKDLPAIIEDTAQVVGGSVDCSQYAMPGTEELAKNVIAALGSKRAAFIANHGVVCWGRDMKEAYMTAELVEKASEIYCMASTMGGAKILDPKEVQTIHNFYIEHYFKRQRGQE